MTIKEELLSIKAESADGLLYAPMVVDWARSHPDSALHKSLEWNDTRAAQEYRIQQVRQLIRVHVIAEDGAPQLVSLTFDRKQNGGYRAVDDVLKNRDLSDIMLKDALDELTRIQTKYQRVQQLTGVWREVEKIRRRGRRAVSDQKAIGATA